MKRLSSVVAGLATLALAVLLSACASTDEDPFDIPEPEADSESALLGEDDDEVARQPWTSVGAGVAYKRVGDGPNVVAIYGGYSAQLEWVERWCNELYRVKGAALDIGHLYAVKGPNDPGYRNHEVENKKLAKHLVAGGIARDASSIVVIAHSSGTYVADELFRYVKNGTPGMPSDAPSKISYFDLDGGGPADPALLRRFAHAYFVWAYDSATRLESHNASGMKSLGATYAALGGASKVAATRSGCDPSVAGGLWCMHDALINTRPHNPRMYDLRNDYTDFRNGRALVTSYLAPLAP